MAGMSPTSQATGSTTAIGNVLESSADESVELRRLLENASRSRRDLRGSAERARREHDHELAAFFERCALSDEARITEASQLLRSRTRLSATEIATSAAFAVGDGADDADVSPDSKRGRVGVWPAF